MELSELPSKTSTAVRFWTAVLFLLNLHGNAVDLHTLFGADEDVLDAAQDSGFHQLPLVRGYLDFDIGGIHQEFVGVHQILGAEVRVGAEGLVEAVVKGPDPLFRQTAGFQYMVDLRLGDDQGLLVTALLVLLDHVAELGVDGLGEIVAYQRPKNSGSQTALEKLMGDVELMTPPQQIVSDGMGDILENIEYRNLPNAIGYSFRFYCTEMVGSGVKLLSIDGMEPTLENIRSGAYPHVTTLYAVTRKGESNPNVPILLSWLTSEQGQKLVEASGYVAATK